MTASAQSTKVVQLQTDFPSGQNDPAIVVCASDAPLAADAKAAIDADLA